MSEPYAIVGNTAYHKDLPQSLRGDFLFTFDMRNGTPKSNTPTDLTGSEFVFRIYSLTGDVWIEKTVGDGIAITGSVGVVQFEKEEWSATNKVFVAGCNYAYALDWTNATGFDKPLFEGKIQAT